MDNVKSILITGVGGQGTLLAARILGDAAIRSGYEAESFRGSWNEPARRFRCDICQIREIGRLVAHMRGRCGRYTKL